MVAGSGRGSADPRVRCLALGGRAGSCRGRRRRRELAALGGVGADMGQHGGRSGATRTGDLPSRRTRRVVEAMERCGNRRPRLERLVSAWDQGTCNDPDLAGEPDDPLIGASAEPKRRPRTRLTDEEVDAMRTARAARGGRECARASVRGSPGHGVGENAEAVMKDESTAC